MPSMKNMMQNCAINTLYTFSGWWCDPHILGHSETKETPEQFVKSVQSMIVPCTKLTMDTWTTSILVIFLPTWNRFHLLLCVSFVDFEQVNTGQVTVIKRNILISSMCLWKALTLVDLIAIKLFLISSCFYLRVCNLSFYQKKLTSSRPEVFCKKGVLENFTKFTGKHLCQSFFFNKVAGLRPLRHRCFPVNFVKFLTTPISIIHLWWLLLEGKDKDLTIWVTFLRH